MFTAKNFNIGQLSGVSTKNIEEHLKLYAGYVTHTNLVLEKIRELSSEAEKNMGLISGLQRRLGFEYNGMRNHEVYFSLLENGAQNINESGDLHKAITTQWGSFENWLVEFKAIATTRGVGWAMLYYDKTEGKLLNAWVDEQHIGQLQNCKLIIALDMWEHAFVYDYPTSEKKNYIEAFFKNLNWQVAEKRFTE
ncbi:hypothetical protein A3J61_02185 [Candidatus Nomurabacteria bacterium RIFCSPHIGHO2_02_FULL_38_15]|uniref:superoxide dismutase n=1 Tax=Candidatus Nomurabacteria bacterium RIFCSPHIGHO2_02_FULL_38_15 TaxID=1801752 RepID=A0A1F6VRT4_9BACT|nr:MAG: hypothetical protein A3J61_02185 [Candidatus Nomurabacteria bacterium RIFCSPHIGHO2_02_FULL_38_15]